MPVQRCAVEELVPEDCPTSRQGIAPARHGQKTSDRCRRSGSSHQSRVDRSSNSMIREVLNGKPPSISPCCVAGCTKDRLRGGATAAQCLGDPFPLHWVHESCCISDQEYVAHRRRCPDDPHLEPATETALRCRRRRSVEETECLQVLKELRQRTNRLRASLAL